MSEYVLISTKFQVINPLDFSSFIIKWGFGYHNFSCNIYALEKISENDIIIGHDFADELVKLMVKTFEQEVDVFYNRVAIFQKSPYGLVTRQYKINNKQKVNNGHIWLHNEIKL